MIEGVAASGGPLALNVCILCAGVALGSLWLRQPEFPMLAREWYVGGRS